MRMEGTEAQHREELIRVNRIVAEQGLSRSSDGNISLRLDSERLLITPSGCHKLSLRVEDLLVVDFAGQVCSGAPGLQPTSELKMHLEVYRQRPDVRAVLHAHPPYATALTLVGLPFPGDFLPEASIGLGPVPTAAYATPGSTDLAESIRPHIQKQDVLLLDHHGSLCVGRTLEETLIALERLEHVAYTFYLACALGEPIPLPPEELERLRQSPPSVELVETRRPRR